MAMTTPTTTWFAAKQGDLVTLKTLIEVDGHSFDQVDFELKTPFYYACTYDKPHVHQHLHQRYVAENVVVPEEQRTWCIMTIEDVIAKRDKAARDANLSVWDAAAQGTRAVYAHTGKTALYEASVASQAATTAMLYTFFQTNVGADEFAVHVKESRDASPSEIIHRILDGYMSMKEVMMYEKTLM
ncbi:Aste57867_23497 [Aphanomyces stellatus]|uniref:Aste57867_23497 protein n=1 Tax=Aphanomyces stellatus TaxID=120398 RepID=A0A485LSE9_9STRA|nr:hypothetical protein As57867_023426 [Aphanomyces stellatus]VFU00142.1 Aste57867_23497 [Aphanomyces stellatus]